MKILDLSAGNRAIWFDRKYRDAVFVDIRPEVCPDVVADTRELPAHIGGGFSLILFDPPHANYGANGAMAKTYGHFTTPTIRDTIARTGEQAHRVTAADALMALKWHNHDLSLATVLGLLDPYWEPLFGHGVTAPTRRKRMTSWVMLRRRASRV